ncbi:hypothetical protein PF005_g12362 [Phytophthora fragariae]|uniref:Uncharacterized protein n=1 Tax=Phytophthora fragariae TaxID=53985 RepID=A0A6A3RYN0_9STRA|nr:hypothetical protein PF003_g970 [Phytophthora fragariae]KAE8937504.1 hypothetical protein PF009_g12592 [Phytophthora fragariae]KAE8995298.1 hypothetical protein PF011_g16392 [Phytophthora fragariae]KAE9105456.1 hypothetical protein PF007_g13697 [Phytophthora fragariae]KAE9105651.1 hypothetical protein PF010_g12931 [Phytophthora fragariae]
MPMPLSLYTSSTIPSCLLAAAGQGHQGRTGFQDLGGRLAVQNGRGFPVCSVCFDPDTLRAY